MTAGRGPAALRLAVGIFGAATACLLPGLLDSRRQDVLDDFEDEAREVHHTRGPNALIGLTFRSLVDLAGTAIASRRDRSRQHAHHPLSRQPGAPMHALWQDIRYAGRLYRRQPAFAAIAIATLALGIGATTAVFTLVNAALLRPLPYPDPDRLVRIWGVHLSSGSWRSNVNPVDALDWRREVAALESLGLWTRTTQSFAGAGDPTVIPVAFVTRDLFDTLGTRAALGRVFGPEHDQPGHDDEIVLSDGFWRRAFGGDSGAVGRRIVLSDRPVTVVGVLPRSFASPGLSAAQEPDVWLPYAIEPDTGRGGHFMSAVGRLAPGYGRDQAQHQLDALMERLSREFPSTNVDQRVRLESLHDAIASDARPALLVLMAAVAVVLLIACANLANLLLARASSRQREMAVRGALGAGRWRVVRQLLTESLLLSLTAGAIGTAVAILAIRALPGWLTSQLPIVMETRLDAAVLAFGLVVAIGTAVLFGLVPALQATKPDLRGTLTAAAGTGGAGSRRLQTALLVVESALAVVLLVSAVLLVRSFVNLQRVDPGFSTSRVLTVRIALPRTRYDTVARRRAFFDDLLARLGALPGVTAAGGVNMAPLGDRYSCDSFGLADRPAPPDGQEPCAESRVATPGYFEAMGIGLKEGRPFGPADVAGGLPVIVISEVFAAAAVGLAMIGVYGVMAFFVAQRTHEIGVRVALGASPGAVRRFVIGRGMAAAGLGALLGLAVALVTTRLLADLLFGVAPADPLSFALAPAVLLVTALVACCVPARRATRLDPIAAIRTE